MAGTIHRKKKSENFVTLDTHCLRNKNLKWDAKGLHSYLMQLPDDWKINIEDLKTRGLDKRDGTLAPMKALIEEGYVYRERITDKNGRFVGYEYHLFEQPEHTAEWVAVTGKTVYGKTGDGKTVNGKTATSKVLSNNKNEESEGTENENETNPTPAPATHVEKSQTPIVEFFKLEEKPLVANFQRPAAAAETEVKDAAGAVQMVSEWAGENHDTIKGWYDTARRKYAADDFTLMLVKFCGFYANHSDSGKRNRFLLDPVTFVRNQFISWLATENRLAPANTPQPTAPPPSYSRIPRY